MTRNQQNTCATNLCWRIAFRRAYRLVSSCPSFPLFWALPSLDENQSIPTLLTWHFRARKATDLQLVHFSRHVGLISNMLARHVWEDTGNWGEIGESEAKTNNCSSWIRGDIIFLWWFHIRVLFQNLFWTVVILQMLNSKLVIYVLVQLFTKYKAA